MEYITDNEAMSRNFTEKSFFRKIKRFAVRIGKAGIGLALTLFYTAMDSDTPVWAKTVILAALGYLILPIDAIPDIIPGVGFTDDLSALLAAFSSIAVHIKEEHKIKASDKLAKYFKENLE